MPEGPSLRRWCKVAEQFTGQVIADITGTSNVFDKASWTGAILNAVQVYGKQMFVHLKRAQSHDSTEEQDLWLRYHFLMWGSLHANKYKDASKRSKKKQVPNPRMVLHFQNNQFLAFYSGSLRAVDGPCEDTGIDVLSKTFDKDKAAKSILQDVPVCYTLMDQGKFAGVGNIIKNEVLYRTNIHPLELGTTLTECQAEQIANQVVMFTKSWLDWEEKPNGKKFNEQMMIYWKFQCPLGHKTKRGWFGDELKRMTVWCPSCQPLIKESEIFHKEIVNTKKVKGKPNKKTLDNDEEDKSEISSAVDQKKRKRKKSLLEKEKPAEVNKNNNQNTSDNEFEDPSTFNNVQVSVSRSKRRRLSSKAMETRKTKRKANQGVSVMESKQTLGQCKSKQKRKATNVKIKGSAGKQSEVQVKVVKTKRRSARISAKGQ